MVNNSLITRHPVVIHALLQTCTSTLSQTKATPHSSTSHANLTDIANNNDKRKSNTSKMNDAFCSKDNQ